MRCNRFLLIFVFVFALLFTAVFPTKLGVADPAPRSGPKARSVEAQYPSEPPPQCPEGSSCNEFTIPVDGADECYVGICRRGACTAQRRPDGPLLGTATQTTSCQERSLSCQGGRKEALLSAIREGASCPGYVVPAGGSNECYEGKCSSGNCAASMKPDGTSLGEWTRVVASNPCREKKSVCRSGRVEETHMNIDRCCGNGAVEPDAGEECDEAGDTASCQRCKRVVEQEGPPASPPALCPELPPGCGTGCKLAPPPKCLACDDPCVTQAVSYFTAKGECLLATYWDGESCCPQTGCEIIPHGYGDRKEGDLLFKAISLADACPSQRGKLVGEPIKCASCEPCNKELDCISNQGGSIKIVPASPDNFETLYGLRVYRDEQGNITGTDSAQQCHCSPNPEKCGAGYHLSGMNPRLEIKYTPIGATGLLANTACAGKTWP
jgi:hypothetical protein